jgi:NhaA family Na+:H+ antiporter
VGKTAGISLAAFLAVRLLNARLPANVRGRHVVGAAAAAGIPFTVSLFISELALPASLVQMATMGVLAAGVLAGVLALLILRWPKEGQRASH